MTAQERTLRRAYARALKAEHRAVERASNSDRRSLDRAWAAADKTNAAMAALQAYLASEVSP